MKLTKQQWELLSETDRQQIIVGLQSKFEPQVDLLDDTISDVDWITNHLYIPELPGAIWLSPYQKRFLNEALSKDKNGLYKYSLILYLDKKKHIKSCIAAGVALRRAFQLQWGNIMVVSNSLTQSQSRSFYYIIRSLLLNPFMRELVDKDDIKINRTEIVFNFNKTKITAVPLAPDTQAGNNNDLSIFSEIWAYRHDIHQRMITETAVPPNLYGKAQRFMESYVGFQNESVVLERWFEQLVKPENLLFDEPETYISGQTIMMWNHGLKCRMPWVTDSYLAQQSKELTDSEFRRVMLNEWVSSENKFIDDIAIYNCKEKLPPLANKEKIVIAVDAAYGEEGDYFAIVGVSKHPTDKSKKIAQRLHKVWRATKEGKLQFKDANKQDNPEYPFGYLMQLCKLYNVVCITYDPYQLHSLASEFEQKRIAWMKEFNQGKQREQADNDLYKLIRDREIAIQDDVVIEHLNNANSNEKGRLIKRNQSAKIDLAVALSMACFVTLDGSIRI